MKAKSRLPHISEFDSKINRLIELNIDGSNTNETCAANATSRKLRDTFVEMTEMYQSFAGDIKMYLEHIGIRPKQSGTLLGAFNKLMLSFKTSFSSNNQAKALYQSIDHVLRIDNEYEFVLNKKDIIPEEILELIESQHTKIKSAVKKLRTIEKTI